MEYSVVIVASGTGSRMNVGYNKVFYQLDNERIIDKTINAFKNDLECKQIIVVTNKDDFHLLANHDVVLVEGGKRRQDSVENGLMQVSNEYVMIHDGARPYISYEVIERVKNMLLKSDACVVCVPSIDTVKMMSDNGLITLERDKLFNAQTPQAFKTKVLKEAYKKCDKTKNYTDDTSLVAEVLNIKIENVLGDYGNIKITTMKDISK